MATFACMKFAVGGNAGEYMDIATCTASSNTYGCLKRGKEVWLKEGVNLRCIYKKSDG